jgi:hypothetical protein
MADRLSLANALAEAKIDRPAAERIATEIFDAIHNSVATKSDLELLENRLRADIALLEHRLLIRLGALIVAIGGLLLAAIRYLPAAH